MPLCKCYNYVLTSHNICVMTLSNIFHNLSPFPSTDAQVTTHHDKIAVFNGKAIRAQQLNSKQSIAYWYYCLEANYQPLAKETNQIQESSVPIPGRNLLLD